MLTEIERWRAHCREGKKIHDVLILFHQMNASILVGQLQSIVQHTTHIKVLEKREMERRRLAILVLQCTGDLPEALLYELDFSTLLIDYALYEVQTSSGDELEGNTMQKELEIISEKRPLIEQWAHLFGDFLEPILPEQCTTILKTLRDLQRAFTAISSSVREQTFLIVPLYTAGDHGKKLTLQLASYREVCRNPALKYLQQRQQSATLLSHLAKELGEVLMVAGYQTVSSASTGERQQRAGFSIISNTEEE